MLRRRWCSTLAIALLSAPLYAQFGHLASPTEGSEPRARNARPAYRIIEQSHRYAVVDGDDVQVGRFLSFRHDSIEAIDAIEAAGPNLFRWRRTFSLKPGHAKQQVRLLLDFEAAHTSRFAVVPGISWNGNHNDLGNIYRGFSHEGEPWSFASHRTLIPGASYSEGDRHTVGLFAEVPDSRVGLSCSLVPGEDATVHRLILPEEEMSMRVLNRERGYSPGRANTLELNPGQSLAVTAWLVLHPLDRPKLGYRHLLDAAWTCNYKPTASCHSVEELWRMGLRFARESLWDDHAKMFHLALLCDEQRQWVQGGGFSIGWCGRNGELANALLAEFLRSRDAASLTMALECLDAWTRRVSLDADSAADPLARFQALAPDANTLSDGAAAFLRASSLVKQCGVSRPAYREIGLAICDAAIAAQKPDGSFGGPSCRRGAIGSSFIPPLLTAFEVTGNEKYLEAAKSALRFYLEMLYRDGALSGGALDTQCVDKESVLPLLAGAVRLFELTGDSTYLIGAEDSAYYFAAWQIAQTIPNAPGSLADAIGYETFGGTSVATVHMCADPFGVAAVPQLLRLAQHTGKEIWTQRARALWNHASQGISTGTLALQGLPPRPCGSQDETINYTDWGYDFLAQGMDRQAPRGAGQCWLTAWPTAMRLTVLSDPELRRQIEIWKVNATGCP